jgi:hypothetical protein
MAGTSTSSQGLMRNFPCPTNPNTTMIATSPSTNVAQIGVEILLIRF